MDEAERLAIYFSETAKHQYKDRKRMERDRNNDFPDTMDGYYVERSIGNMNEEDDE